MPEVELDDITLAYEIVGDGDPLLLVAGCGQPAAAFHLGLAPRLAAAGYRVILFDNRGVPPSSMPPAPYTIAEMADDALGLLDHLGLTEPVRIAGDSLGGWIAETLAIDHPERVRAAALMGSANAPTSWKRPSRRWSGTWRCQRSSSPARLRTGDDQIPALPRPPKTTR